MTRRFQFSLRTTLLLVFVIALVTWPSSIWLRSYLANRGLVPVKGRVIFKGQPLQDAQVVMAPVKAGGKPVQGLTNARGEYEMEAPLLPGQYTVSITEMGATKRLLSLKYANASSGLTIMVSAEGSIQFDFELSD